MDFKECLIINASHKNDKPGFFNEACDLIQNNVLDVKLDDDGLVTFTSPLDEDENNTEFRVIVQRYSKDGKRQVMDEGLTFRVDAKTDIHRILESQKSLLVNLQSIENKS